MVSAGASAAPVAQNMSQPGEIYAASMENYRSEMVEFNQSPYRSTCEAASNIAFALGCLGYAVATPLVGVLVDPNLVWPHVATLASGPVCLMGSCMASAEADKPSLPDHPDHPVHQGSHAHASQSV